MMYKQAEVIIKLDGFLQYSIIQKPQFESYYINFINQLKQNVTNYFTADRSGWKIQLTELQYLLYSDLMKRRTKYGKKNITLPTNFPASYNDVRKCFADFSCIMNTTDADFFGNWIEGIPETSDESASGEIIVTGNSLITTWISYLSSRISSDLNDITALCSWLENASNDTGVFMLYEDMGEVIEAPTTNEIAQSIFIDRYFKECIDILNLPTHKPTWL